MNPLTSEWIEKAEKDFATASREIRARKMPNYDAVCFHPQQCAEKYLKAILQERNLPFGKTHNLTALLDLLLPYEPSWELMRPSLQRLGVFAVQVRYPGDSADKSIGREALNLCRVIRSRARFSLGLENETGK
jgi:HEPN domain-containing protein